MNDQQNGMAKRRKEQLIQQRMSAMLTTIFSAGNSYQYSSNNATTAFGAVYNTAVKWHSAVNHISQVLFSVRRLSYVMLHIGYTICVPWKRRLKCFTADIKQNNDVEV